MENRIKAVLADKKVLAKTLANELGVSLNTMSRWCSNVGQPPLDDAHKIAKFLNVDINELIREIENE